VIRLVRPAPSRQSARLLRLGGIPAGRVEPGGQPGEGASQALQVGDARPDRGIHAAGAAYWQFGLEPPGGGCLQDRSGKVAEPRDPGGALHVVLEAPVPSRVVRRADG
jgi:hypothetical protein